METGIALNIAYCGPAPTSSELPWRWNLDPWLIAVLVGAAWVLACVVELRRRPAGLGGMLVLLIAFVSPLCALSSALFSARVVHHVLLVACAAPLLAYALPMASGRRRAGTALGLPFTISSLTLWLWHAPVLYTAALESVVLYWIMQLSLLGTAVWFWRAIFTASAGIPTTLMTLAAAFGQMGLLGAILTFAPYPLYPHHALSPLLYGLTPLQDQQLGGLIMWIPALVPYALIALILGRRIWRGGWAGSAS